MELDLAKGIVFNSEDLKESILIETPLGKVYALTRPAPVEGRTNEDSIGICYKDNRLMIVVADGLGGHKGGNAASKIAAECMFTSFTKTKSKEFELGHIIESLESGHERIKELKIGGGSTFVAAIIDKSFIRFVSLGDSVGYLVSGQKNLKFKTLEQSPVGYGVEAGLIKAKEALYRDDNHIILNAMGIDPLRFEVSGALEFSERDFALLASDGLTSNLLPEEVISELTSKEGSSSLDVIADKVKSKMLTEKGHCDDLSMILFMKY